MKKKYFLLIIVIFICIMFFGFYVLNKYYNLNQNKVADDNLFYADYKLFKTKMQTQSGFDENLINIHSKIVFPLVLVKIKAKRDWQTFRSFKRVNSKYNKKEVEKLVLDIYYKATNKGHIDPNIFPPGDIFIHLSTLPLEQVLLYCDSYFKEYYEGTEAVKDCEDNVYLYRATTDNNYCNLINAPNKYTYCVDVLDYIMQSNKN